MRVANVPHGRWPQGDAATPGKDVCRVPEVTSSRLATQPHDDIVYPETVPFVLMHAACVAAIWTGVYWQDIVLCAALYFVRMFAVTAGYHRYFSHRAYRTSRWFHFVLGFLAQSTAQQGVIWWAAKHRHHHKYSDTPEDVHSPLQRGFFWAHVGWIFGRRDGKADYRLVKDLCAYPELRWLDHHKYLPVLTMALGAWLFAGWSGLVVGFLWSTVLTWHGTFMINSLAHVHGKRRYLTGDDSRNNWLLALTTLGEGWHNNHHYFQSAARQGFRWWEVDITYYLLKALSWIGVVWELKSPPRSVLEDQRRPGRRALDRTAELLAQSVPVGHFVEQWRTRMRVRAALVNESVSDSMDDAAARWEDFVEQLPTVDDFRARARRMYRVPADYIDQIAARAHDKMLATAAAALEVQNRTSTT